MKKIIEIIIKSILIVALFISLLGFAILNILSKTIFNQGYTLQKLEETNYYGNIYTQIKSDFRNYIYQSGLDEDVIEDVVTLDEVKQDTKKMITGIYSGIIEEINTEQIEERLNNNIKASLEGRSITPEIQEAIEIFVNQITTQYEDTLSKTVYKNEIYKYYSKAENIVKKAEKITIVVAVISGVLIVIINFKKIFKNIGFLGIPFLSAGIGCKVIHSYIKKEIYIEYFTILNDAITITLREYLLGLVEQVLKFGYIYIATGIVLIVFGNVMHGLKYHSHRSKNKEKKTTPSNQQKTEPIVYKQIFGQESNESYNHNYNKMYEEQQKKKEIVKKEKKKYNKEPKNKPEKEQKVKKEIEEKETKESTISRPRRTRSRGKHG